MLNIIFAADDYFSSNPKDSKDVSLTVDDVKLIYYSRLDSLSVDGVAVPNFSSDKYNYTMSGYLDEEQKPAITATLLGQGKSAKIGEPDYDYTNACITVTVTNDATATDIDGENSHTYTLQYAKRPEATLNKLTIGSTEFTPDPSGIINTNLPWTSDLKPIPSPSEGSTASIAAPDITTASSVLTVTNPNALPSTKTYTVKFLPFEAVLESVVYKGERYYPTGSKFEIAQIYDADKDLTPYVKESASGKPEAGKLTMTSDSEGTITVRLTDLPAGAPAVERTYTVSFSNPSYSRITGVTINGTTYTVADDGTNIDASRAGLPVPLADDGRTFNADAVELQFLPGGQGTAQLKEDSGTFDYTTGRYSFTVVNSNGGADTDGKKEHDYTVQFAKISPSRLASLTITNDKGATLSPTTKFSHNIYEYTVDAYMPSKDSQFETMAVDQESNVTVKLEDAEGENPTARITVTGNGMDYDGKESHEYILHFNKRSEVQRSSRLASLTINGTPIEGFDPNVLTYNVNIPYDRYTGFSRTFYEYEHNGEKLTAEGTEVDGPVEDPVKATRTYIVRNQYPDENGEKSHEYVVTFIPFYTRAESVTANGTTTTTLDMTGEETVRLTFAGQLPAASAIGVKLPEVSAGAPSAGEVTVDPERAVATFRVTNGDNKDTDGIASRTYLLQFDMPYFSRLGSLSVDGVRVDGFDSGKYEYTLTQILTPDTKVEAVAISGGSGEPVVTVSDIDPESAIVTVTVSNSAADTDGESTHTYTLRFMQPYRSRIASLSVAGTEIALRHDGEPMATGMVVPADADALRAMLAVTLMEASGTPEWDVVLDSENLLATITVTNTQPDTDGQRSHKYVLTFVSTPVARLATITVGGVEIGGFDPEVFEYTLPGLLPAAADISATAMPGSGNPEVSAAVTDAATARATITVTNGSLSATYTLQFELPCPATLSGITIGGTQIDGFDAAKTDYDLTDRNLPAADEIAYTLTDARATATVSRDEATSTVTITVSSRLPEATTTYTLRFKTGGNEPVGPDKPEQPDQPTDGTTTFKGTLTIMMMGEDLTGGGQEATVVIDDVGDGTCTFRLPDFSLDLGDGPASLGDIVVENVAVSENGGVTTYNGTVNGLELADGAIIADVTLTGTVDADGKASMTIGVVWSGINIDVEFNGEAEAKDPVTPQPPADNVTVYEGMLTIMMMGEDLTEGGQAATVEIEDGGDGTCTFRLPDFSLDLGDGPASLGDIVVENVTVSENGGVTTYSGTVNGLELADGAIVADVNLTGTVDADGNAHMTIGVVWSGINIDVEFNGEAVSRPTPVPPADDDWTTVAGRLTIELNAYDITEGGLDSDLKIRKEEDGTYTFMLPDFSLALDAAGDPASLGDITVSGITMRESDILTVYTGSAMGTSLAGGEIMADIKLGATETTGGVLLVNVDVVWSTDDGRRVPIMVRFTNRPDANPAEVTHAAYTGTLSIGGEGEPQQTVDVTVRIRPLAPGRASLTIDGIEVNAASRAAAIGRTVTFSSVCVSPLTDRLTAYDGNNSGLTLTDRLVVEATIHGIAEGTDRITLSLDMLLPESGKSLTGTFTGNFDADATGITSPGTDRDEADGEAIWYDLRGVRVDPSNLRPGIYLKRTAKGTEKVLIR